MKITCHMIMSADGRLLSKYWSPLYNDACGVGDVYEATAAKMPADGWIVGRNTMAEYGEDLIEEREPMEGPKTMHTMTFVGKREGRPLAVVLTFRDASITNPRPFRAANISSRFWAAMSHALIRKNLKT